MKIPCEECLTFSICRNRYLLKFGEDDHLLSARIFYDCSLLSNFRGKNGIVTTDAMRLEMCKIFRCKNITLTGW